MSGRQRVCLAFGTRPEATKMAPVAFALAEEPALVPVVLVTGQHREQLDQVLALFDITPDMDLDVMTDRQTLPDLLARIVRDATRALRELEVDYVLVHGDTLTTFAVALAAFYEGIPVGHVEAGLRSFDLAEPFPEEANRRLTDVLTDLDLPPTPGAQQNLLAEGKRSDRMVVTGQTAVDAVRWIAARSDLPADLIDKRLVTVTMHRRENLPVLAGLADAVGQLARAHPERVFVYPVHLNPVVREAVWPVLSGIPNVMLVDPWPYDAMAALMAASDLIVTDSGGLQEEGAALGVPVAVLRNVTERPEGVASGSLRLVGNDPQAAGTALRSLLADEDALRAMRSAPNPYGDGRAGERVARAVAWRLGAADRPADWQP